MKAEKYWTFAEQKRYDAGWIGPAARKKAGIMRQCRTCANLGDHAIMNGTKPITCELLQVKTMANATCREYTP